MDKNMFFKLINHDYFDVKEAMSLSNQSYKMFSVEDTLLVKHFDDVSLRYEMKCFFEKEYQKDHWAEIVDELTYYVIQMLSANSKLNKISGGKINDIEQIVFELIESMFTVSKTHYSITIARRVYINHMNRLRDFLTEIMDIVELENNK